MAAPTMKIGILQCDDVMESLRTVHGNYPDMFVRWLSTVDPDLDFTVWRCHEGDLPESTDAADAWLITGSKYGVNDDLEWITRLETFVRKLHEDHKPIVGFCFGHQMIGRALGGAVRKHPGGWGVGMSINTIKQQLPWMNPWKPDINLLVSHQDQVYQVPEDAVVLAENKLCAMYMILVDQSTLGIQGHPEFSKEYARDLMEARRGVIPDDVLEAGLASLDKSSADSKLMALWVRNFLSSGNQDCATNNVVLRATSE